MGADGHIQIYSMKKLEDKYDKEIITSFFDHFGSSTMYRQKLENNEYVTRYYGDNLSDVSDMYEVIRCTYDPKQEKFNKNYWNYDAHSADYFMKLTKKQRDTFYDFIHYMEKNCKLTSWEVWT